MEIENQIENNNNNNSSKFENIVGSYKFNNILNLLLLVILVITFINIFSNNSIQKGGHPLALMAKPIAGLAMGSIGSSNMAGNYSRNMMKTMKTSLITAKDTLIGNIKMTGYRIFGLIMTLAATIFICLAVLPIGGLIIIIMISVYLLIPELKRVKTL